MTSQTINPLDLVKGVRLVDRIMLGYARAPDHLGKLRVLKLIASALSWVPMLTLPGGATLSIDANDYIGWSLVNVGAYEPRTLRLARHLMVDGGTFIDVGANVGLYSLAIGAIRNATVVAVEPDSANGLELRLNIERNELSVRIFSGALGRAPGFARIQRRSGNNSGSAFITSTVAESGTVGVWVPVSRLDDVIAAMAADLPRPKLIKLDIEGAERDALEGLNFAGPHRPENVILEVNQLSSSVWGGHDGLCRYFADRGYELYSVDGERFTPNSQLLEDNVWAKERPDS